MNSLCMCVACSFCDVKLQLGAASEPGGIFFMMETIWIGFHH